MSGPSGWLECKLYSHIDLNPRPPGIPPGGFFVPGRRAKPMESILLALMQWVADNVASFPLWVQVPALIVALALVVCSGLTNILTTPDPATTWGKVYRIIEYGAWIGAKAKESGVPLPSLDEVRANAIALVKAGLAGGEIKAADILPELLGSQPIPGENSPSIPGGGQP